MEYPASWRPITEQDLSQEVIVEYNTKENPQIETFIEFLKTTYLSQSGLRPHSLEKDDEFRRWLAFQSIYSQTDIQWRRWPHLQGLFFSTFSDKASGLAQRICKVCKWTASEAGFGANFIAMRMPPITRQVKRPEIFKAFQAAIKSRLLRNPISIARTDAICLTVTYILSSSRRDKDLDNMTKALLDAIDRALDFDDKRVHHLDILKLFFDHKEEYVLFRIAPTEINERQDVILPIVAHSWAGQDFIDLKNFL